MAEKVKKVYLVGIMWDIRDAHVATGSQRQLLDALALRANLERNFTCFPSYTTLANDTGLNKATLKRAAMALQARKLIMRRIRKNRSNIFRVNVELLSQLAEAERAKKKAAEVAEFVADSALTDVEFSSGAIDADTPDRVPERSWRKSRAIINTANNQAADDLPDDDEEDRDDVEDDGGEI